MTIDNNTIRINRGNSLSLDISIKDGDNDYVFKEGDVVGIAIYTAYGMNKEALASKFVNATAGTTVTNVTLTSDEMKIGDPQNYSVTCWYEITLNNETVLGYDEEGAKELILYPEGA